MWFLPTNPNNLGAARDFVHVPYMSGYSAFQHGIKTLVKGFSLARAAKGLGVGQVLGAIPSRMLPTQGIQRNRTIYGKGNPFKGRPLTGSNPKPIYGSNLGKKPIVPARRAPVKRYLSSYLKKRRMKRRNKF